MPTSQVVARVIAIALILSAIDAVAGRFLQASRDPSVALFAGAGAWASYRLAADGRQRLALGSGILMLISYAGGFIAWTRLLVGWNGSTPWSPRSGTWMVAVIATAVVATLVAHRMGSRAHAASASSA